MSRIPNSEPSSGSTTAQLGFRPCLRAQSEPKLARSVPYHEWGECCAPETRSLVARQLTPLFGLDKAVAFFYRVARPAIIAAASHSHLHHSNHGQYEDKDLPHREPREDVGDES